MLYIYIYEYYIHLQKAIVFSTWSGEVALSWFQTAFSEFLPSLHMDSLPIGPQFENISTGFTKSHFGGLKTKEERVHV